MRRTDEKKDPVIAQIEQIEGDWARKVKPAWEEGNLDRLTRRRVAGVVLGAFTWDQLAERFDVSPDLIRRVELGRNHEHRILDAVNRIFPAGPILNEAEFEKWTTSSKKPVAAFYHWLMKSRRPRRIHSYPLPEAADSQSKADKEMIRNAKERTENILAFLQRSDLRNVKVVYQEGMMGGLRTLAATLIRELPKVSDRDICCLSVGRDPETQERITFPRLVRDLYDFYRGESDARAEVPHDAEGLRRLLTAIRAQMMRHPAILIFDGHRVRDGALPDLRSMVADDALTALLREVLHPLLGHSHQPEDPARYYENRVLILADADIQSLQPLCDEHVRLLHLSDSALDAVLTAQGREHRSILRRLYRNPLMTSDAVLALADTVISLRVRSGASDRKLAEGLVSPDACYGQLVAELIRQNEPLALFALRMVALTDGGLRRETLVRLVDQWRKLTKGQSDFASVNLPALSFTEVDSALACVRQILVQGPDERIPGLDDMVQPYVYLDEEETGSRPQEVERLQSFDLRASALRSVIVQQLVESSNGANIAALMHRLLAEEALRQQTHAVRHAEWRGDADIRYYRRHFQMLFHGYASLGGSKDSPVSEAMPVVLPAKRTSTYRRLHSVFFRALLEHPPHFDLSRSLGRDRLKVEILQLAMSADLHVSQVWRLLHGDGQFGPPRVSDFLKSNGVLAEPGRQIAIDQQLTLARAAHMIHDLDLTSKSLQLAQDLIGGAPAKVAAEYRDRAAKIELDLSLNRLSPDHAADSIRKALSMAGFKAGQLAALKRLQDKPGTDDPTKALHDGAQRFLTHCRTRTADQLANWSDLLCRLGEAEAMQADLARTGKVRARYRAFVTFYLAERIRREAFDREPIGRAYVVNSHATRVFVRTTLQLVRAVSHPRRSENALLGRLPHRRDLIMSARRHIDLLTRYSARYSSERPSLLILEATFTRSVGGFELDKLLAALKSLDDADLLSFTTPDRPRVRWRLILERIKVFRALMQAARTSTDDAVRGAGVRWWKLAVYDAIRLWRLCGAEAASKNSPWRRAIGAQVTALMDRSSHGYGYLQAGLHYDDNAELLKIAETAKADAA